MAQQHDMTDTTQWTWSDGWILMALYLVSRDQGANLYEIIAAADATNHAIPTAGELSSALTKFAQCGLIWQHEGRYSIVGDYLSAIGKAYDSRGGLFATGDKGLKWLRRTRLPAQGTDCIELSDAEVRAAYDRYVEAIQKH